MSGTLSLVRERSLPGPSRVRTGLPAAIEATEPIRDHSPCSPITSEVLRTAGRIPLQRERFVFVRGPDTPRRRNSSAIYTR